MKIRVYDMKSNDTIFRGSVKKTDTLEGILLKAGNVNFKEGFEKSFTTKAGKVYNYFNIVFEVI